MIKWIKTEENAQLVKLVEELRKLHEDNLRPAQPKGLWEHHKQKAGLFAHSYNVASLVYQSILNEDHYDILSSDQETWIKLLSVVFGLGHDIIKVVENYDDGDHAHKSAQVLEDILNNFELSTETKDLLVTMVKYHHLNFENPEAFAKKGNGLFPEELFPFVLVGISADLLSIGGDMVIENIYQQ
jgi:hypothetical protein